MRLLAPEHAEILLDADTWRDNPFLRRESRRDTRRKQPVKSFAWMSGTLLILGGAALWLLSHFALQKGKGVPWWLGGDLGAFLCIIVVGIHSWYIIGAAQKNALPLLTQEAYRNTLSTILLLPISRFQLLVQATVYPWLAAMRTAFVLLPVYIFCVGLNGVSLLDIGMLYVTFALTVLLLPVWRRPALGDNLIAPSPSPQTANVLAPKTQNNTRATTGANNQSSPVGLLLPLLFAFFVIGISQHGFGSIHQELNRYLPDSLLILAPASILSWPLLIGRALVTPLDWFGFPLPPLPFVLALFALGKYLQIVRVSEFLSVGTYRDLALQPTYLARRKWEVRHRTAQTFVLAGYLWKWMIPDGHIRFLTTSQGPADAPGLVAFAWIVLAFVLGLVLYRGATVGRWLQPSRTAQALVSRRLEMRSLLWFLTEPFVCGAGFFLACCLLARTWPFPPEVCVLAGQMLLLCLSGLLMAWGARQMLGLMISLLLTGLAVGLTFSGAWTPPEAKFAALLSPAIGAIRIGGLGFAGLNQILPSTLAWWMWPAVSAGSGLSLLLLVGLVRLLKKAPQTETASATVLRVDPTQVGEEVFSDPMLAQTTQRAQTDSPLARRLIAAFQYVYDNAVITRELRARLRGKLEASSFPGIFGTFFVITAFGLSFPFVPEMFGSGLTSVLYGLPSTVYSNKVPPLANITACWYIPLLFIALFSGFSTLVAFAQEREKSTLGFLLTTPLSAPAIVIGKTVGLLIPSTLALAALGIWTLLLSLVMLPTLGGIALLAWLEVMLTAVLLLLTVGLFSLAIASLLPQKVSQATGGIIGVFAWMSIQFIGTAWRWIERDIASTNLFGLGGFGLWLALLLFCCCVSALAFMGCLWGVRRMRQGDMAFAASKREN